MTNFPFEVSADLVYDDPEGWHEVVSDYPTDVSRWSVDWERVIGNDAGEFVLICWSRGATEYQDEGPENVTALWATPVQTITYKVKK